MLVLTRKVGEVLIVGNTIRIKIIEIGTNVVRLGFDAPAEISIYREELYREIAEANRSALNDAVEDEDEPEGGS